jgi:hypothetical protein
MITLFIVLAFLLLLVALFIVICSFRSIYDLAPCAIIPVTILLQIRLNAVLFNQILSSGTTYIPSLTVTLITLVVANLMLGGLFFLSPTINPPAILKKMCDYNLDTTLIFSPKMI